MSYKPLSAPSTVLVTKQNTNYVSKTPLLNEKSIEHAIGKFGVAPGGLATMKHEREAAMVIIIIVIIIIIIIEH